MRLRWIKTDRVPDVQWPERHADHPEKQTQRKENPKRLGKIKVGRSLGLYRCASVSY